MITRKRIRAEKAAQSFRTRTQDTIVSALVGDGAGNVEVTGRGGWVWVRLNGSSDDVAQALNRSASALAEDAAVDLKRVRRYAASYYEIVSPSDAIIYDVIDVTDDAGLGVKKHAAQHLRADGGAGGSDPLDVHARMVVPLRARAQASPDMTLYVEAGYHAFGYFAGGNSPTFTAPTGAGIASRVDLLYIGSDNALHVLQGTTTGYGVSLSYPALPSPCVPVAFVRVDKGLTAITEAYIVRDARMLSGISPSVYGMTGLLDATAHSDALTHAPVRGDLIVANSTPKWSALTLGAVGKVLQSDGSDAKWSTGTITFGGASSSLVLPDATTTITGGGTLALGGYTLTVPATGTAVLTSRTISTSGTGLSGGGDLSADRTITLTSSSNPGAAARILASDASGYLTLTKLYLRNSAAYADHLDLSNPNATGDPHFLVYVGQPGKWDSSLMFRVNTTDIFGLIDQGGGLGYQLAAPSGIFIQNDINNYGSKSAPLQCFFYNQSSNSAADSVFNATVLTGTSGDPYFTCGIATVGTGWSFGLDNSSSDRFKLMYGLPFSYPVQFFAFDIMTDGTARHNLSNATTNASEAGLTLMHTSSGVPANGFGIGLQLNLDSSTTANQNAALISADWATATHASRKARLTLSAYDTAIHEGLRIEASGSEPMIGFYGVTAIVRAVLATGASHTVDDVITALQNLGLVKQS